MYIKINVNKKLQYLYIHVVYDSKDKIQNKNGGLK